MSDQRVFTGLGDNRLDELGRPGGAEVELPTLRELEVYFTFAEPLRDPLRSGDGVPHLLDRMPEPALEAKDVPPVDLLDRAVGGCGLPGRVRRHAYSFSFGLSVGSAVPSSSRWRSSASRRSVQNCRYGASQASISVRGSARTRYQRRWASTRTSTSPASRSTRRCFDTPGWLSETPSTS